MTRLSSSDRDFLQKVERATFSNPFGAERWHLDAEITGAAPEDPEILAKLAAAIRARLGKIDLGAIRGEAKELVEAAQLFIVFHDHADTLDELIAAQMKKPDQPVPFPRADEVLADLHERGFGRRAPRALELFYQLRRAYFFIARGLVGRSLSMRRLRESLWSNVFTRDVRRYEQHLWNRMEDFSTILLGATGTGKGACAAAIGRSGFIAWDAREERFAQSFETNFVPVNLSEYPESLIESELFGHRKGAFTGAIDHHAGVFSRCNPHGAIFLDEIGELAPPMQVKLLRVLEERRFFPLGSHASERFEGRVIAATHRSLDRLREEKKFRDDLYYRLCSDVIAVPDLATRIHENPAELDDLLGVIVTRVVGRPEPELVAMVDETIARDLPGYTWPGNVRELAQCVRRVLLTGRCRLGPAEPAPSPSPWSPLENGELSANEVLATYCAHLYARLGSYEAVAKITQLDRRTVKKHVLAAG